MALGLSQIELAEKLEIKSNTISRYERGASKIPKAIELSLVALECLEQGKVKETSETEKQRIEKL